LSGGKKRRLNNTQTFSVGKGKDRQQANSHEEIFPEGAHDTTQFQLVGEGERKFRNRKGGRKRGNGEGRASILSRSQAIRPPTKRKPTIGTKKKQSGAPQSCAGEECSTKKRGGVVVGGSLRMKRGRRNRKEKTTIVRQKGS